VVPHQLAKRNRGVGRTGRGPGRDDGAVEARLGDNVHLDGGVATGIVDVASVDLADGHFDQVV